MKLFDKIYYYTNHDKTIKESIVRKIDGSENTQEDPSTVSILIAFAANGVWLNHVEYVDLDIKKKAITVKTGGDTEITLSLKPRPIHYELLKTSISEELKKSLVYLTR